MTKFQQFVFGMVLVILGVNIVGLWSVQYLNRNNCQQNFCPITNATKTFSSSTQENNDASDSASILKKLQNQLEKISNRVSNLENSSSSSASTTKVINNTVHQTSFQKQTIYLGNASSFKTDWTDTDISIALNSYEYPKNVTVTFEAALSIIGGEASARLINETTGLVLYQTQVSHNNSTVTWKSSQPFTLINNLNTYRVQLRSSSSEYAILSGARLIIDD